MVAHLNDLTTDNYISIIDNSLLSSEERYLKWEGISNGISMTHEAKRWVADQAMKIEHLGVRALSSIWNGYFKPIHYLYAGAVDKPKEILVYMKDGELKVEPMWARKAESKKTKASG